MPSAVGCIRKGMKASARGWSLLVVVDWSYGKHVLGLRLSCVERMLESHGELVLCEERRPLGCCDIMNFM